MDSSPAGRERRRRRRASRRRRGDDPEVAKLQQQLQQRIAEQHRLRGEIDDIRSQASSSRPPGGDPISAAPPEQPPPYWSDSTQTMSSRATARSHTLAAAQLHTLDRDHPSSSAPSARQTAASQRSSSASLEDRYRERLAQLERLVLGEEARRVDKEAALRRQLQEKEAMLRRLESELGGCHPPSPGGPSQERAGTPDSAAPPARSASERELPEAARPAARAAARASAVPAAAPRAAPLPLSSDLQSPPVCDSPPAAQPRGPRPAAQPRGQGPISPAKRHPPPHAAPAVPPPKPQPPPSPPSPPRPNAPASPQGPCRCRHCGCAVRQRSPSPHTPPGARLRSCTACSGTGAVGGAAGGTPPDARPAGSPPAHREGTAEPPPRRPGARREQFPPGAGGDAEWMRCVERIVRAAAADSRSRPPSPTSPVPDALEDSRVLTPRHTPRKPRPSTPAAERRPARPEGCVRCGGGCGSPGAAEATEQRVQELSALVQEFEGTVLSLSESLGEKSQQLRALGERHSSTAAALAAAERRCDLLEGELAEAREAAAGVRAQLSPVVAEAERGAVRLAEELERARGAAEAAAAEAEAARRETALREDEIRRLRDHCDAAESRARAEAAEREAGALRERELQQGQLAAIQREAGRQQEAAAQARGELARKEGKVEELLRAQRQLMLDLEARTDEAAGLRLQLAAPQGGPPQDCGAVIAGLKREYRELYEERARREEREVREFYRYSQEQIDSKEREAAEAAAEADRLRAALAEAGRGLAEGQGAAPGPVLQRGAEAEGELRAALAQRTAEVGELREALAQAAAHGERAEGELQGLRQQAAARDALIVSLEAAVGDMGQRAAAQQPSTASAELEERLRQREGELARMREEMNAEYTRQCSELRQVQAQFGAYEAELQSLRQQLAAARGGAPAAEQTTLIDPDADPQQEHALCGVLQLAENPPAWDRDPGQSTGRGTEGSVESVRRRARAEIEAAAQRLDEERQRGRQAEPRAAPGGAAAGAPQPMLPPLWGDASRRQAILPPLLRPAAGGGTPRREHAVLQYEQTAPQHELAAPHYEQAAPGQPPAPWQPPAAAEQLVIRRDHPPAEPPLQPPPEIMLPPPPPLPPPPALPPPSIAGGCAAPTQTQGSPAGVRPPSRGVAVGPQRRM